MQPSGPRFNYEDYMKNLNNKLTNNAPNSSAYIGSDF